MSNSENIKLKVTDGIQIPGPQGEPGASAYEIAVEEGFIGTEEEWLESLVGPTGAQGPQGPAGKDGKDGVSPEVTISTITGGHRVNITDADHPSGQNFDVMDGQDGATGPQGPQGPTGADGFTPTISVAQIQNGYEIEITNATKTTTIDIYNGEDYILTAQDKADIADLVEGLLPYEDWDFEVDDGQGGTTTLTKRVFCTDITQ